MQSRQAGETAQRYVFKDGKGEIGLINSITQPFCRSCSRARVTADGMLHTCLFSGKGTPLRPLLRRNCDDQTLQGDIRNMWSARNDRFSEIRHLGSGEKDAQEMYRMGG